MPRVLDADIKSFFDEIDNEAILSRTPVFRRVIEGWLKAGVFEGEVFNPTDMGTPQGGVASPLLANIALHGLKICSTNGRWWAGASICVKWLKHFPNRRKAIGSVSRRTQ